MTIQPNVKTMINQINENELGLLKFITCGSVDDGKSTLIGRLLYDAGQIYDDHLEALDEASKKFGTQGQGRDFALLVDGLAAEREQGITIDVAYRYFRTSKRAFIVADTPGHEQYTRNMATGASNAEVAIILIDARKGVLAQTRRHALIVSMLGVKNIALAINKMDLVNYDKAVFDKIIRDFHALSPMLKFDEVRPIPISAVNGENIANNALENMPWYKGPHLLEFLETVIPRQNNLLPFRFPVQWVNRPNLNFRGFSGYVSSGSAKIGQKIRVSSSGQTANIARIVTMDGDLDEAIKGQAPTIVLDSEIDVSRGDILTLESDNIKPARDFIAKVFWMSAQSANPNKEYIIKQNNSQTNARINITSAIDFNNLIETPQKTMKMNGIGQVEIHTNSPIFADAYVKDKETGSFILIDKISNETVALGLIQSQIAIEKKQDDFEKIAKKLLPHHVNPVSSLKYLLHWRVFIAVIFSALIWVITKNFGYFCLAILAEFILRPILQWAHYNLFYMDANSNKYIDDNIDGSGI